EPGARVPQVQVHRVLPRHLEIHTVKKVFLVSPVVKDGGFRSIQKAAAVEAVQRNVVTPLLPSVEEVEAGIGGAERAVRSVDAAMRGGRAHARTRGHV